MTQRLKTCNLCGEPTGALYPGSKLCYACVEALRAEQDKEESRPVDKQVFDPYDNKDEP